MERHERIRQARETREWSQAILAERAGTNQQTIDRIEKGANSKHLSNVLKALGLDLDGNPMNAGDAAPSHGEGHFKPPPSIFSSSVMIPIYASAEGGKGHMIASTDEIGRVNCPDILLGYEHAYAILITGTSMVDAYEPGDRALVNPHLPPRPKSDVILYSLQDGEAKATIKRLETWTDTTWTLRQFKPPKIFKLDRAEWQECHQVVGNLKGRFGGAVPGRNRAKNFSR